MKLNILEEAMKVFPESKAHQKSARDLESHPDYNLTGKPEVESFCTPNKKAPRYSGVLLLSAKFSLYQNLGSKVTDTYFQFFKSFSITLVIIFDKQVFHTGNIL